MNHNVLRPQWKREEKEQRPGRVRASVSPVKYMFSLRCDGFRGMNGHDLVIFWMDDFKCLLEAAFMRQILEATAQSGSLWDRSTCCLSELVKALGSQIPNASISVSMIPAGTRSLLAFQIVIRHHVIGQKKGVKTDTEGREGETGDS